MNIVHFTDTHLSLDNPRAWKVPYLPHMLANLEYVFNYALRNEAILVHSGDLFHVPNQSNTLMRQVLALFHKYKAVPFYTCLGQHDVIGHSSGEYENKSIALLEAGGHITILNNGASTMFKDVVIRGYSFRDFETAEFLKGQDSFPVDFGTRLHIALVHASVGSDDCMGWDGISHQNIKTADLTLFGDIHPGFRYHEFSNGCAAIGLGSFGRRRIDERDRPTQFAHIKTFQDPEDPDFTTFSLSVLTVPELSDDSIFHEITVEEDNEEEYDPSEGIVEQYEKFAKKENETPPQRVARIGKAFQHSEKEIGLVLTNYPKE